MLILQNTWVYCWAIYESEFKSIISNAFPLCLAVKKCFAALYIICSSAVERSFRELSVYYVLNFACYVFYFQGTKPTFQLF